MKTVQLSNIAYARSGDKGDVCNVGLLARDSASYALLEKHVTPERVKEHFGDMVKGAVEIYPLPNIEALEIVLRNALGGGATRTLRFDQTGKAMGTALLRMHIPAE